MNKRRIIVTAQSFGYGPCSKAVTISSYLKRFDSSIQVDFTGSGTALDFAASNYSVFDNIIKRADPNDYSVISNGEYDSLISIMDPTSVLCAKQRGKKTAYVDSLYFFWNWREILDKSKPNVLRDSYLNSKNSLDDLLILHPHERQLIGHILSDHSFIQKYPGFERKDIKLDDIGSYTLVNPIIDLNEISDVNERDTLMISFCGQISPLVDVAKATDYAKMCLKLLEPALSVLNSNTKCLVVGNPEVVRELKKSTNVSVMALPHTEYLRSLNRSLCLIVPVSITSTYEALAYNVPVIFLPEQHDGHGPNHMRLIGSNNSSDNPFPGILFYQRLPQMNDLLEKDVSKIYDVTLTKSDRRIHMLFNEMSAVFREAVPKVETKNYRDSLVSRQRDRFEMNNSFSISGGYEIAKKILSER